MSEVESGTGPTPTPEEVERWLADERELTFLVSGPVAGLLLALLNYAIAIQLGRDVTVLNKRLADVESGINAIAVFPELKAQVIDIAAKLREMAPHAFALDKAAELRAHAIGVRAREAFGT